ncbi:MAG: exo-alpha-sialidase [Clostridia bacterium]|nr:exo-alpha-sialidase [Clostridia bacterium]
MSERYYDVFKTTAVRATEDAPRHSEASVIELKDGSLLMAWQCHLKSPFGSNDRAPSNISLMNSKDGGATWQNARIAAEMTEGCVNVYSPTLFRNADGSISLYFKRYTQLEKGKPLLNSFFRTVSFDEGESWSGEETLWENETFGTINHAMKRLSDGSVLLPVTEFNGNMWEAGSRSSVFVLRSEDEFSTWSSSNKISVPMRGLMEPCIAERPDGTLNMVMRTQLGSVFYSESKDGGKTWSKAQTTGLKAPESCPCVVSIPNSDAQLVVWNNSEYDMSWRSHYGKRTPLTLAISHDGLRSFQDFYDIETDPNRAFTNPAITVTEDGLFVLNYWTSPYSPEGRFSGPIDLKIATFRIRI